MPRGRFNSATDEELLAAYREHGTAAAAGRAVGMSHTGANRRLEKLGINATANHFTAAQRTRLRAAYRDHADRGRLSVLAAELGKSLSTLRNTARNMGLTGHDPEELRRRAREQQRDRREAHRAAIGKHSDWEGPLPAFLSAPGADL
jgi:hypothetical protein